MSSATKQHAPAKDSSRLERERRARARRRAFLPFKLILEDPLALTGSVILVLVISMAVFAPLLATHDPNAIAEEEEGSVLTQTSSGWAVAANLGASALNDIATSQDATIVVGRSGTIYEREGGRWHAESAPSSEDFNGIAVSDTAGALVVGASGTVLSRAPGTKEWVALDAPSEVTLHSVAWLDDTTALIVGNGETIWLLDTAAPTFKALESPVGRGLELRSVAAAAGEALIVGERGLALAYSEGELTQVRLPNFRDLNHVTYSPSGEGALIVGERGTLLRLVEGEWVEDPSPDARALRAGYLTDDGQAFAVGRNGVVLALEDGAWVKAETGTERHFRAVGVVDGEMMVLGSDPFVNKLAPPSTRHWFGTDHLGRDLYSQNIYGSRIALIVGFIGALLVVLIGTNVGLFAGYFGGRTDTLLMRAVDVMYGIPFEPFAMILVLLFDPSLTIVIVAVSLLTWRTVARLIRSQVLSISQRPFVKAARVAGASNMRIIYQHIAPNILPLVLLQLAIAVGASIVAEATLSFLGLGPPKSISWGGILHNARLSGAWRTAWWWNIPPGAFIMLTVLGVFFISRALEVLANPRLRSR